MEDRKWKILKSEYLIKRPWLTARRDYVQLPDGREKISTPHLDATEDLEVHLLSREKVFELLKTNQLVQSLMVAPLCRYFSQCK